jgi:hypothetical protein
MNLCPSSHIIFLAWVGAAETDADFGDFYMEILWLYCHIPS